MVITTDSPTIPVFPSDEWHGGCWFWWWLQQLIWSYGDVVDVGVDVAVDDDDTAAGFILIGIFVTVGKNWLLLLVSGVDDDDDDDDMGGVLILVVILVVVDVVVEEFEGDDKIGIILIVAEWLGDVLLLLLWEIDIEEEREDAWLLLLLLYIDDDVKSKLANSWFICSSSDLNSSCIGFNTLFNIAFKSAVEVGIRES